MEPKRSKYDTNPLDKAVSEHAGQTFEPGRAKPSTEEVRNGPTNDVGRLTETVHAYSESEAPTRRIDNTTSYPSIFVPPNTRPAPLYKAPPAPLANIYQPPPVPPSSIYQPPPVPVTYQQGSDKVAGLGIPEKWAVMLPYLPFWLAIVKTLGRLTDTFTTLARRSRRLVSRLMARACRWKSCGAKGASKLSPRPPR